MGSEHPFRFRMHVKPVKVVRGDSCELECGHSVAHDSVTPDSEAFCLACYRIANRFRNYDALFGEMMTDAGSMLAMLDCKMKEGR